MLKSFIAWVRLGFSRRSQKKPMISSNAESEIWCRTSILLETAGGKHATMKRHADSE